MSEELGARKEGSLQGAFKCICMRKGVPFVDSRQKHAGMTGKQLARVIQIAGLHSC